MNDDLVIAGVTFKSRLITGTGKHRSKQDLLDSVQRSGTEMITVAIRRLNLDDPNQETLLDHLDWDRYRILPNTPDRRPSMKRYSRRAWRERSRGPTGSRSR